MSKIKGYSLTLIAGIVAALFVRIFVLTAFRVPTGSMQPALMPGDFIFAYRMAYRFQWPKFLQFLNNEEVRRGQLIVFSFPSQPQVQYVKRVIGLPGDNIEFDKNHLRINGEPFRYEPLQAGQNSEFNPNPEVFELVTESGLGQSLKIILGKKSESPSQGGNLTVPEGHFYVLGDNRETSDDSRYWGSVPKESILGQVVLVWMSFDTDGKVRWERILKTLH